ncbi:MAG: 2-oxoacid:acceptor oxidoreductase family protein [Desulfurella sp.]|uniref:2-oxoglutarate ferredoxin oxidoreductase subunit gamma n=3 Tax=Desulfurella TaxID=33001 RepID=A0A1G6K439_9BACT|nr:2-oxoacid:acceptor oxidoreductase family protein [Desulfurella multipotens]PMP65507.1 MAG: hypothetical protein C0192_05085 [Desulfurella multipotens]SDC25717.1 2-oxoglutarate ferredoxin oxidoreductase subunit gamma [Desulfurella multipotens]
MGLHYELRFVGIGGQGNMLAGTIIAEAAVYYENKYATQVPTYTSQVRGGPTKADVIISDEPIQFAEATHIDFLLALDQRTYDMYKKDLKEGAIVLVDSGLVNVPEEDHKKWDVYGYPIVKTAKYDIGNVVTANILAVGMTVELTGILDKENVKKAIADRVPPAFLDLNMKAYETGIEIAKKLKAEKGK